MLHIVDEMLQTGNYSITAGKRITAIVTIEYAALLMLAFKNRPCIIVSWYKSVKRAFPYILSPPVVYFLYYTAIA